ncbi:nucleolar protein [Cryptococcus neoformans Ze90-1]|nr:nucleolar protein [Cryptococcus neoformans var. grubii Ze90-1]
MPTPRVTRSRSSTPLSVRTGTRSTPQPGSSAHPGSHHKTSDELALEEAASLLHTPTARLRSLGSADIDGLDGGSARALRHKRLNQVREEVEVVRERSRSPQRDEKIVGQSQGPEAEETEEEEEQEVENSQQTPVDGDTDDEDDEASRELMGVSTFSDAESTQLVEKNQTEEDNVPLSAPLSTGQIFSQPREVEEFEESASESGSETESANSSDSSHSSSESESDSESDSEDDSSDSDSDEDDEKERLLQAARDAAKAKTAASMNEKEKANEVDDEIVLQFDKEEKEAPIPDLAIPKLPRTYLSFPKEGRAQTATSVPSTSAGPSRLPSRSSSSEKTPVPELDDRPYERPLSKRERALQPRKATTSELWASIPTPRADILPQMRKDYRALALANSLDPKRFMKGGSKSEKIPESFAIGTMVETSRQIRDTTLTKDNRYRPGQVVQNIIRDQDMEGYAKRKYGDLQWSKMENGRGRGWKKRAKWQ